MAKILIADDDPQVLQVLASVLKGAGHEIVTATDGEQAFALWQQQKMPIVVLDVMMPKKAGQGVGLKIKRESPQTQVLLVSGIYTDPSFIASAPAQYQNDGFLTKPFQPQQLLDAIKPLLAKAGSSPAAAPAEAELVLGDEPSKPPAPVASPWPNRAATPTAPPPPVAPKPPDPVASAPKPPGGEAPRPPLAPATPPPTTGGAQTQSLGPQPSFAVEGALEKVSVVGLLYRCWIEKLFGKLTFKKDVATKEIWVRDGKLIYAMSNLETDRLEHRLLSQGKLTGDQYQEVTVLAKGMGGIEAALVRLNVMPGAEVFEQSKQVAMALALEVFKWLGGRYTFTQGSTPPSTASLDVSLEEIIHRGLRESFDRERLERAMGGRMRAPAEKDLVRIADVEKLKLAPAEFRLSRMIDAKKTPEAIAKEWAAGDVAKEMRALQLLYLMTEAGMLRFADTQETKKASAETEGLKTKLAQLEKGNLFDALGLKKECTVADVKKAYFALARQFHPDTLPTDANIETRKLVDAIFSIISRANQVLQDNKQREEYLKELSADASTAGMDAEKILTAEIEFQKGEFMLLRKRDVAGSEQHLATALKLNPGEAEHHVLWGWFVWLKQKNAAEAQKHIMAGLKIRDNVPNAYLFLGHMEKAKGDMDKAEKLYRKVLTMDERNAEAQSELRVIAMRKGKK